MGIEKDTSSLSLSGSALSDYSGIYNYTDSGGEQTIFEIKDSEKKIVNGILIDLANISQNGTLKLYSKIDGNNYREFDSFDFNVTTDSDGVLVGYSIPVNKDFKITYTESIDEGAIRQIPFSYILEG